MVLHVSGGSGSVSESGGSGSMSESGGSCSVYEGESGSTYV